MNGRGVCLYSWLFQWVGGPRDRPADFFCCCCKKPYLYPISCAVQKWKIGYFSKCAGIALPAMGSLVLSYHSSSQVKYKEYTNNSKNIK